MTADRHSHVFDHARHQRRWAARLQGIRYRAGDLERLKERLRDLPGRAG